MPTIPPEVYGPAGLLVFLTLVVWRLWKLHEQVDLKRETLLDTLTAQLPELITSNRLLSQTIADRLAGADRSAKQEDDGSTTLRQKRGSST